MLNDDFINSEMLAEKFVDEIRLVRDQLENGNPKLCLDLLFRLEEEMQQILALGDLYSIEGDLRETIH